MTAAAMGIARRWKRSSGLPRPQPFDWLAFDVETANSNSATICAVGVALVRDGRIVDSGSVIVDPQVDFHWYHSALHGIDADVVVGCPIFADVWPQLAALFDNRQLVAHSASFDVGALRRAVAHAGLLGITAQVACTWRIARMMWPEMPSFGLGYVAPQLGYSFNHHESGSDAEAAAYVALRACTDSNTATLAALFDHLGYQFGQISPASFVPAAISTGSLRSAMGSADASTDHPLYGQVICFTGGMFSMSRTEVVPLVVDVGATFVNNMSGKVNFLVIGDADFVSFADGHRSGKLSKAIQMKDAGKCDVEIMGEREFMALLHSG